MSDRESPEGEIRYLEIQIARLRRERDDLRAGERGRSPGAKVGVALLRLALVALWLVGAACGLVLVLYVLLMTGIFRMGPG